MDKNAIANIIESNTSSAKKTYEFNTKHNPKIPADYWFEQAEEGLVFFVVFYTQACRWSKCLGCNLPSRVSKNYVPFNDIMKQVDFIFDFYLSEQQKKDIRKVIVSNNGSVLDEDTFPTTALIYLVSRMNMECPNVMVMSMESRPEYVDLEELEVLSRALREGEVQTKLELAIGFEAYDEKIRNEHFNKGLTLSAFEHMVEKIAKYGYMLKVYLMQKPVPEMGEDEAETDIKKAIDYLDKVSQRFNVDLNIHLNPTYVAKGTILEEEFNKGNYTPPLMESVRRAVLHARNKSISVYVGLYDEGLAVEGGSFIRKGEKLLVEAFEHFNQTQDFDALERA